MRIVSVVGARPQFIKVAPVAAAFQRAGHEHLVIHTGQHYDDRMSGAFFRELNIPAPEVNLAVGSGTPGTQTASMVAGIEQALPELRPDWVVVYGDTNSTLAGAIATAQSGVRLAHVEAGLRSFNRTMPEELNRVLADHAADLLLAPTKGAMANLAREGLGDRAELVGDVARETFDAMRSRITGESPVLPDGLRPEDGYLVATVHRQENTDDLPRLSELVATLGSLPLPVVLVCHPRLIARANRGNLELDRDGIHPVDPLSYREMLVMMEHSQGVVTDSGGLQKEAWLLRRPCTSLRAETEWGETLAGGWNALCTDLNDLPRLVDRDLGPRPDADAVFGSAASERIVAVVESWSGA